MRRDFWTPGYISLSANSSSSAVPAVGGGARQIYGNPANDWRKPVDCGTDSSLLLVLSVPRRERLGALSRRVAGLSPPVHWLTPVVGFDLRGSEIGVSPQICRTPFRGAKIAGHALSFFDFVGLSRG